MKGADLLKFLLSIIVVWIYTGTNDLYGLTKFVVPILFFLSGFFLSGKMFREIRGREERGCESIVGIWLLKTLRLYVIWTVIYLPFAIVGFEKEGIPVRESAIQYIQNVVFVGENYLSWPLWYLLGLLQAGIIIWIGEKIRLPLWGYLILALMFYLLPDYLQLESNHLYLSLFKTIRNGFFLGFPCMVLGGLFHYIFSGITGWPADSSWFKVALTLRFFSTHIYLTHMLWGGVMILAIQQERGIFLWAASVCAAIATGFIINKSGSIKKILYGRS